MHEPLQDDSLLHLVYGVEQPTECYGFSTCPYQEVLEYQPEYMRKTYTTCLPAVAVCTCMRDKEFFYAKALPKEGHALIFFESGGQHSQATRLQISSISLDPATSLYHSTPSILQY